MKKIILLAVIALGTLTAKAQETKFGITAGYSSITQTIEFGGSDSSIDKSGFFVGITTDIPVQEQLYITPSILYTNYTIDGVDENFDALQIPILAKYYVAEQINIAAGPQINYELSDSIDDYSNLSIGLTFGAGYDITENLAANLNYNLQLSNSYTGDDDFSSKQNYFNIGLAYKL